MKLFKGTCIIENTIVLCNLGCNNLHRHLFTFANEPPIKKVRSTEP